MCVTIDDHDALYAIAENSPQRFIPFLLERSHLMIANTNIFLQVVTGLTHQGKAGAPGLREGLRVREGQLAVDPVRTVEGITLLNPQLFTVRQTGVIQPGLVVLADRVDPESLAVPVSSRIAQPVRIEILVPLRQRTAQADDAERVVGLI